MFNLLTKRIKALDRVQEYESAHPGKKYADMDDTFQFWVAEGRWSPPIARRIFEPLSSAIDINAALASPEWLQHVQIAYATACHHYHLEWEQAQGRGPVIWEELIDRVLMIVQ